MLKVTLYNQDGSKSKEVKLPKAVFGVDVKEELITRALTTFLANKRAPVAHTKVRSERRGGGAKPWKQKGTGRARHGSNRSPLWKKGGITFGPRSSRNFSKNINKKEKKAALLMSFTLKAKDNAVTLLDDITLDSIRTKAVCEIKDKLGISEKKSLIVLPAKNEMIEKSARNIPDTRVVTVENVNIYDVLDADVCVMLQETCKKLEERFTTTKSAK